MNDYRISFPDFRRKKFPNIASVLSDEQIALFLLSCDRDPEFTLVTIRAYFAARLNGPQLFNNRHLDRDDLQYQLGVIRYSVFPRRTPDGSAIMFHSLHDCSAWHYHMEHSMKLLFMTLDSTVYDDPPTGLVILFDMKGVGLMHLTRVRLGALRTFCQYFIDKVHALLRPFVRKELYDSIHFHPPSLEFDEFHRNFLPKECLPSDFGGDLESVDRLHEENIAKLQAMRSYFDAEEEQRLEFYNNVK